MRVPDPALRLACRVVRRSVPGARARSLVLALVACGEPEDPVPPATITPLDLGVEVGWRTGGAPALTPEGAPLARQAYLRVDVRGAWSVPTPEPTDWCRIQWTWATPPAELAEVPEGLGDVVRAWRLRTADAAVVQASCPLEVAPDALLGGVIVGVGPSPYGRWQDAVAALPPSFPIPDVGDWPWLDSSHVLGARIVPVAADDAPLDARDAVGVALRTVDDGRLVASGGGLLETVLAAEVLAPDPPDAYLRVGGLQPWTLAWPTVTE